jgi:cardiolipin synthase
LAKIIGVEPDRKVGNRRRRDARSSDDLAESTTPVDANTALDELGASTSARQPARTSPPPAQEQNERKQAHSAPAARNNTRNRILTVPNMLSFARIGMVPLFLWLVLGPQHDELAIAVLIISGITDYLDGKIARSTGQVTALGALLDPIADRLFILAAVVGLTLRDVIPWWLAVLLVSRDVIVVALVPILRTRGFSSLPVHFLGKAATAVLLYAFPLLLLGDGYTALANLARVFGWAFTVWGVALYWWAGILYFVQLRHVIKTMPKVGRR